jgi:hypothetical protein
LTIKSTSHIRPLIPVACAPGCPAKVNATFSYALSYLCFGQPAASSPAVTRNRIKPTAA